MKGGLFCKEHREPGMVDVVNKTCARLDCELRPTFNAPGKKGGLFCKEHRELVSVTNRIGVGLLSARLLVSLSA
jgi:hypothetical protein